MSVMIVGGGVGGLTLGLALHARGIEAEIYEQASEVRELGVGINTLPHAIKELANLGLLDRLDRIGIRTSELVYKLAGGQDILRQPRGRAAGYDVPQFSIHRGKLQKLLFEAAVERLGAERVHSGQRLVRFSQDGDKVTGVFTDRAGNETERVGDVLIGADGIHSTVRRHYHPDQGDPSWNGMLMWRGATWWKPYLDGKTMIIAGGMSAKLVLYPIFNDPEGHPGETLMNWVVGVRLGDGSMPIPHRDDWSKPGLMSDVMPHVTGTFNLPELDIEALIAATPEFYVYPMCDRDPLSSWTDGRVTLLGDAAHPMYPVGSNGASQAILDAMSLAGFLSEHPAPEALKAYEEARRPATTDIVISNRKGGPERVIDLVEDRAPNGFDNLHDVATPEELRAIVGDYSQMAGFATEQVNRGG